MTDKDQDELLDELQEVDFDSLAKEGEFDKNVVYEGEIENEDGSSTYVRVVETPDGFVLLAETEEHGGAIIDFLPTEEMAIARAEELVTALATMDDDGE
jgi:hypothetical protein